VIFERFAHELLVRQELEFDEIEAIFAEYGKANPRAFGSKSNASGTDAAKPQDSSETKN